MNFKSISGKKQEKRKKYKCSICYTFNKKKYEPFKSLPSCKCNFCKECLTNWVLEQLNQVQDYMDVLIRCPHNLCTKNYKVSDFMHLLSSTQKVRINDVLMMKYCQSAPDIRNCPNHQCNYYGILSNKICNKFLICPVCKMEWDDYSLYDGFQKFLLIMKHFLLQKNEIFSIFYKAIFTKKCDSCKSNIEKNHGCSHVRCLKCKFDFCWICNQKWVIHDLDICQMSYFTYLYIILQIIVLFAYKVEFVGFVTNSFYKYTKYIEKYFLFDTIFVISGRIHMDTIKHLYTNVNHSKRRNILFVIFFLMMISINYGQMIKDLCGKNILLENIMIGIIESFILFKCEGIYNWLLDVI